MDSLQVPAGSTIEHESFRIIHSEIGDHPFTEEQLVVATRVIHATADFDFVDTLRFHQDAISAAVHAFQNGADVVCDVGMVEVGISKPLLQRFSSQTICAIREQCVCELAKQQATTRSVAAMRYLKQSLGGNVVAIGNAPTALYEVIRLVEETDVRPALIIGVPVGFVNTAESKERLLSVDVPYITALGRKGGSTVAVAVVNALLGLADQA